MLKGQDFVFTGLQPWDISIGSNAKDIALEVSKNNRVLYVNTPLVKWSSELKSDNVEILNRLEVLNKRSSGIRQINPNLWVLDCPFTVLPVNALPDGFLFDSVNYLNNRKIFKYVADISRSLGFKDFIHFIDNDIYRSFYSHRFLNARISVYYLRDNLLAIDFWRRHASRLEPKLIAKCDLVLCNSTHLAKLAKVYNINSFDVGQGFNPMVYQMEEFVIPDDIMDIPRPIIGYIGAITSLRLNPDLIYYLALRNPQLSFVLVGKSDDVFNNHELNDLPNTHFLGQKMPSEVPSYINSFDICINPQIVNSTTIGNYPRKIDEYLALGKPVIATKTETMSIFEGFVYLCETENDYQTSLMSILRLGFENGKEDRRSFAFTHSWSECISRIYNIISNFENEC